MGATNHDGPVFVYGNMGGIAAGYSNEAVPDPNGDAGPSMTFQGDFLPDVRFPFLKDKVQGYTGVVPGHWNQPIMLGVDAVPAALGSANVAAAQALVAGTAMTLASAQAAGITPNVPIRPTGNPLALNSGALTNVLALDFGFAFGNIVAGNNSVQVADSTQFVAGEPLVIMQSATSALLTNVTGIVDATHITVGAGSSGSPYFGTSGGGVPTATNATAPIGTGNYWGPSPMGYLAPDAALPYIAAGPGLLLDTRQSLMRGLSFTGVTGGTGGNVLVTGYDVFGQLQTQLVALPVGAATTKSTKTWKYILSIMPQAGVDTTHNYSVGTADLYGSQIRNDRWENDDVYWAGAFITVSTGWTKGDQTTPATNATGDPRGTYATQSASTGAISGLAMSGNRLAWYTSPPQFNLSQSFPQSPQFFYGPTPA